MITGRFNENKGPRSSSGELPPMRDEEAFQQCRIGCVGRHEAPIHRAGARYGTIYTRVPPPLPRYSLSIFDTSGHKVFGKRRKAVSTRCLTRLDCQAVRATASLVEIWMRQRTFVSARAYPNGQDFSPRTGRQSSRSFQRDLGLPREVSQKPETGPSNRNRVCHGACLRSVYPAVTAEALR